MLLEFEPKLADLSNLLQQKDDKDQESIAESMADSLTESLTETDNQGDHQSKMSMESDKESNESFSDLETLQEQESLNSNDSQASDEVEDTAHMDKHSKNEKSDFFDPNEMHEFADKMEENQDKPVDAQDSDDFEFLYEEDSDQEIPGTTFSKKTEFLEIKYEDYFVGNKAPNRKRKMDQVLDVEMDDEQPKSQFEKQQEKMSKIIEKLESEAVADKDWTLKGEVSAKKRPMNSLLEQDLDVDFASKPVPVMTEEVTLSLEDMIKQRIKDEAWDDVIKKVVIQEKEFDPNRKREDLDQKSSKSLAHIYEEEYVRQTQQLQDFKTDKDEALEKQHLEIQTLFNGLVQSLDALSNYHFTPRPPVLEVKVLPPPQVGTISMEDVMPSTIQDTKVLAPHEVYQGKVTKSKEEMTSAEHKRARAVKKASLKKSDKERVKAKKDAESNSKMAPKRLSDTKASHEAALKELTRSENVTLIVDSKTKAKLKNPKANIIQKGDKVKQEAKKQRAEFIKL